MPEPINMTSEVARIRAHARESAHRYAERCQVQSLHDEERRKIATVRLNAIVSICADLSRQLAALELEVLAIADVLA